MPKMFQRNDVRAVGHRRVGYPEGGCEFADLVGRMVAYPLVDLVGVDVGQFGDRQRRILVDPLRVSDHRAQVEPLLRGPAAEVHQTVLRGGHARDGEPPGVPPRPAEHLEVRHRIVSEAEDLGLQHRQVDEFTLMTAVWRAARIAALA